MEDSGEMSSGLTSSTVEVMFQKLDNLSQRISVIEERLPPISDVAGKAVL